MKISPATQRYFAAILTLGLLAALVVPFATMSLRASQQSIALAPGDQLVVSCETVLTDVPGEKTTTLDCAAPTPTPEPISQPPDIPPPATDTPAPPSAANDEFILYDDNLNSAWYSWSWDTDLDFASQAAVQSGTHAIAATFRTAWAGIYLHTDATQPVNGSSLHFWLHGGDGSSRVVLISAIDAAGNWVPLGQAAVEPGTWVEASLPINLGGGALSGLAWQETAGAPQPTLYLDQVSIQGVGTAGTGQEAAPVPTDIPSSAPQQPPSAPAAPTAVPGASSPVLSDLSGPMFMEAVSGDPASPQSWDPANWDITVHSRGSSDSMSAMAAQHGSDCSGPANTHTITSFKDTVFQCRSHIMTAINGSDYGAIYLTPNQLLDFSASEGVIRFDMSTRRSSERDWVDIWITPFDDSLQLPLEDWLPDLQGEPRRAVHVRMVPTGANNEMTMFKAEVIRDFNNQQLPTTSDWNGYEKVLLPDAARRDTFEIRLTRTHIKVGMPKYNLWWVDTSFDDLGWDSGVIQFGHHSYNPTKCGAACQPNTWHWDNFTFAPARPFTILKSDRDMVSGNQPGTVSFSGPAPANAHLRFAGLGSNLEVSFDGGASWMPAAMQQTERHVEEHAKNYWTPIPQGIQSVLVRGSDYWGGPWYARDFSVWAP